MKALTQKDIDRVFRRLKPKLPRWVAEVRADQGWDEEGDPYVRAYFLVEDEDFESIMPSSVTRPTERRVAEAFRRELSVPVNIHYRTLSEQAEFDEEDRRAAEKERRRRRA